MSLAVRLPLPPSVNHYWVRTRAGGVRVSDRGVQYQHRVKLAVYERFGPVKPLTDAIRIDMFVTNSEKFYVDLDNVRKALWDSMAKAGLYWDDAQIVEDYGKMFAVSGYGFVDIRITPVGGLKTLPECVQRKVMREIQKHDRGGLIPKRKPVVARKITRK